MKHTLLFITLLSSSLSFSQEDTINLTQEDLDEVSFDIVEKVPIYPGCDKNMGTQALKECFNELIKKHVSKNFNINIARDLDLPDLSIQEIRMFFKINKQGNAIDIKAKSRHPKLETEAKRVIKLLPKMEPGYVDGKAVIVPYYLPIKFTVSNPKSTAEAKFPVYRGCDETLGYKELKKCTTQKIMDYMKVSINYELADKLFPLDKSTQFQVSFTINKKGKAEKISAKAHKKEMAAEAIQVLKRMPKLKKPGYINGKPTDTPFTILMTIYF